MTECIQQNFAFSNCEKKKVEVDFNGGNISSDGGLLLIGEMDRQLNLLNRAAKILPDTRDQSKITHSQKSLLQQRVYALAQGWEDLNDHDTLRDDPILQTAVGKTKALASAPTLCRMEHRSDRRAAIELNHLLIQTFIESYGDEPPTELVLDLDATDDSVHGDQIGKFFHGYYKSYCFLPLYIFCESQPLLAWLRPANIDGARGAWLALRWIVSHLREAWPEVKITWRADSGFCRWRMLAWSEKNDIDYIVGIARNQRLEKLVEYLTEEAARQYEETNEKVRLFSWVQYGAKKWDHPRLIVAKAEHTSQGRNPRFIITTLKGDAKELYDDVYCPRGDMENRIKEQQLGLFADRTSCHNWWPNQLRLLISALAYVLVDSLRRDVLVGTELESAQVTRIRLELLKIGAVVVRNTRRIKIHLSSSWPRRRLFQCVYKRLLPIPGG